MILTCRFCARPVPEDQMPHQVRNTGGHGIFAGVEYSGISFRCVCGAFVEVSCTREVPVGAGT